MLPTRDDIAAYCERIGYSGVLDPTLATLQALQRAQTMHIPFENLDVMLRRPIHLTWDALMHKLVHGHRGGYCYEVNGLFAGILQRVGFTITTLAARNLTTTEPLRPRTHMVVAVH
nr:arylamine N-acetyltransferase [Ktedonobacterales bacterium]